MHTFASWPAIISRAELPAHGDRSSQRYTSRASSSWPDSSPRWTGPATCRRCRWWPRRLSRGSSSEHEAVRALGRNTARTMWRGPLTRLIPRASWRSWSSPGMASRLRSTIGTTTRAWMSAGKCSSCWSTTPDGRCRTVFVPIRSPTTAAGPISSRRPRDAAPPAPSLSTRRSPPATAGTSFRAPGPESRSGSSRRLARISWVSRVGSAAKPRRRSCPWPGWTSRLWWNRPARRSFGRLPRGSRSRALCEAEFGASMTSTSPGCCAVATQSSPTKLWSSPRTTITWGRGWRSIPIPSTTAPTTMPPALRC